MTIFYFERIAEPAETRHYTAIDAGEACTMLERELAGTDDPDNWSDAMLECGCGARMLYWQMDSHRCAF